MKKVAFLTTIFPTDISYIEDFFDSLQKQTYKNFDIIVVNDNYKNFEKIKQSYSKLSIIELKYTNCISKNREYGINYCIKKQYDIIIFGDIDDLFHNNRVEVSINLLGNNDIVINDLSLFNFHGIYEENYISNRLLNQSTINYDFIKTKNIFGLSNTAISLKGVDKIFIPKKIIAVDWYIFSLLIINGAKTIFTNDTTTYYRQYDNNLIGLKELSINDLKKGIEVKIIHYEYLLKIFDDSILKEELDRLKNLTDIQKIKQNKIINPLWWELI
ncbi:MAG: glycosyltransferase family A protein [Arcobacter sp.]|uniref:glycosyltransferase family A protein n=1 Tax=Arcobacter sp. TaxID=1872629 RepID=UPI003B00EA32